MAILDFIKNRPQQDQHITKQTQQQEAPSRGVQSLSAEVKAQAVEAAHPAAALMDKATQHRTEAPDANSNRSDGKEALRHNQSAPGKTQEAMSPTDSHKGHTQSRGGWER